MQDTMRTEIKKRIAPERIPREFTGIPEQESIYG